VCGETDNSAQIKSANNNYEFITSISHRISIAGACFTFVSFIVDYCTHPPLGGADARAAGKLRQESSSHRSIYKFLKIPTTPAV